MPVPSFNYFGLGTKYNEIPINILDVIALYHDIDYDNAKTKEDIIRADKIFIERISKLDNISLKKRALKYLSILIFKIKIKFT